MATANHVIIDGVPYSPKHPRAIAYITNSRAAEKLQAMPKKRIRQSSKPLLNKLESEWMGNLMIAHYPATIHAQSMRVKLANGSWYKPDMCAWIDGRLTCWEVKGNKGKNIDRGKLALKVAAHQYPEFRWVLVWRNPDTYQWVEQEVLP